MLFFLVSIYLLLLVFLLLVAYSKQFFKYYTLAKALCGIGFIVICCASFSIGNTKNLVFFVAVLCAMVFCLFGDISLGLANNKGKYFGKYFLAGIAFFMLAHILFCAAFYTLSTFMIWDLVLPICLSFCTYLCSRLQSFKLNKIKIPAIFYSAFVGLMCFKGICIGFSQGFSTFGLLVCFGSILFLVSDCIILFLYFYKRKHKYLRALNLSTYYLGILLLALSV